MRALALCTFVAAGWCVPGTCGGDLPSLTGSVSKLSGEGAVVLVREVSKGSDATGSMTEISFSAPEEDGGEPISEYRVEVDTSPTFDSGNGQFYTLNSAEMWYREQHITADATPLSEVQQITLTVPSVVQKVVVYDSALTVIQGDFMLSYNNRNTACIPVGATALQVETAINAAVAAYDGSSNGCAVSSASYSGSGIEYTVTFNTANMNGDIFGIEVEGLGAAVGCSTDVLCTGNVACGDGAGVVSAAPSPITGDFTLSFDTTTGCDHCFKKSNNGGASTANIDPNSPGALESALQGLSNIGPGGVSVTTVPHTGDMGHGKTWLITFSGGALRGDVPQLSIASNTLGGDNTPGLVVSNVQHGEVFGGTFSLLYNDHETGLLSWDASAAQMRDKLEALPDIETVLVTREESTIEVEGAQVSCTHGASSLTITAGGAAVLANIRRGDVVTFNEESFRVAHTGVFDSTTIPLASLTDYEVSDSVASQSKTGMTLYKRSSGYTWTVVLQKTLGSLLPIIPARDSLAPAASSQVDIAMGTGFLFDAATSEVVGCDRCYQLPGLQAGTEYYVRIAARNSIGPSSWSTPQSIIPKELPSAPTKVFLSRVSSTEVLVEFEPGVSDGGDTVTGYRVQYDTSADFNGNVDGTGPLGEVQIGLSAIQGSPPFHAFITGLSTGTTYYTRVAATNSVPEQVIDPVQLPPYFGKNTNWQVSTPTHIVTADQAPLAPFGVDISLVSGSVIRVVTTKPGQDGGVSLTKLKIEWDPSSTFTSLDGALPFCSTVQDISGLRELTQVPLRWVFDIGATPTLHALAGVNCPPLAEGVPYYVRVSAFNGIGATGYGAYFTTPVPVATKTSPSAPTNVAVTSEVDQDTPIQDLVVTWDAPPVVGGSPITSYRVEWYRNEPVYTKQRITVINSEAGSTSGGFTLLYNGHTTTELAWNSEPEDVRFALRMINTGLSIGDLAVERTAIGSKGYRWDVTFLDETLNPGNAPLILIHGGQLVASSGTLSYYTELITPGARAGGNNEVQRIKSGSIDGGVITGYFRLSMGGKSSPLLAYDATADQVRDALMTLPAVGRVTVSRTGPHSASRDYTWLVTFDTLGTSSSFDLPVMEVDTSYLTTQTPDLTTVFLSVADGNNALNQADTITPTSGDSQLACAECVIGETPKAFGFTVVAAGAAEPSYTITGLVTGIEYTVRVVAANEMGYGAVSSTAQHTPPLQAPEAPRDVTLGVKDGDPTALEIFFNPPTSEGGTPIKQYMVQYDVSSSFGTPVSAGFAGSMILRCPNFPVKESVTIETTGSTAINDGGFSLSLTYGGVTVTTGHLINYNAEAQTSDESGVTALTSDIFCHDSSSFCLNARPGSMQAHLNVLTRKLGLSDGVEVTRVATANGYVWTVEFQSEVNGLGVALVSNTLDEGSGAGVGTNVAINTAIVGASYSACTGTHIISGLTQGQVYFARVLAYNSVGYSPASNAAAPAKPVKVPAPPVDVKLTVLSGTSLRIHWSPDDDGGDAISSYTIQWDTVGTFDSANLGSHVYSYLEGGAPYAYTIQQLSIGTFYYVRVAASNSQGLGAWEASSPALEKPMQAPSAPTNTRLYITSESALTVTFGLPVNEGGDDTSYFHIEWDINPTFSSLFELPFKGSVDVPANLHRSYTISNLQNDLLRKTYVRVQARNQRGYGPMQSSNPQYRIPTKQIPGQPHNLLLSSVSAGSITATWNAPRIPSHGVSCFGGGPSSVANDLLCPVGVGAQDHASFSEADGGSAIVRFNIEIDLEPSFTSSSSAPHKNVVQVNADATDSFQHIFTGLTPGRLYFIRVAAENAEGMGGFTESMQIRPL